MHHGTSDGIYWHRGPTGCAVGYIMGRSVACPMGRSVLIHVGLHAVNHGLPYGTTCHDWYRGFPHVKPWVAVVNE